MKVFFIFLRCLWVPPVFEEFILKSLKFVLESLEFPPESLLPDYIPKYSGTDHLQENMENKDLRLLNVQTFTQPGFQVKKKYAKNERKASKCPNLYTTMISD